MPVRDFLGPPRTARGVPAWIVLSFQQPADFVAACGIGDAEARRFKKLA